MQVLPGLGCSDLRAWVFFPAESEVREKQNKMSKAAAVWVSLVGSVCPLAGVWVFCEGTAKGRLGTRGLGFPDSVCEDSPLRRPSAAGFRAHICEIPGCVLLSTVLLVPAPSESASDSVANKHKETTNLLVLPQLHLQLQSLYLET